VTNVKIGDAARIPARNVTTEGAEHVTIKWLISKSDGAPRFQMRLFEVAPGGKTPYHRHDWEHEVYIVEGGGKIMLEGEEKPFAKGHFLFVPPAIDHSFVNTGKESLAFLCMIPV
jgi:quercetin dioxygenase-like cupin family protein